MHYQFGFPSDSEMPHPFPEPVNVEICFFSREDHFCINVTDDGPGIPPKELEKLFIPFYTTKHHGTGIGLSLSKQIILGHNGKITLTSQPYVQTTFGIEL